MATQVLSALRRGNDEHENGAVLIETAFILVLLVALLVGTISAAIAYGRDNSIQNAAREGSRYGATLPGPNDVSWLRSVRDVTRAAAAGDLDTTVPGQVICVALGDGNSWVSLVDTGGVETQPNASCFSDGRPAGEFRVQVSTQRLTTFQVVFFGLDADLSAESAARYERLP